MYIDAISDQVDEEEVFSSNRKVCWNGRKVEALSEINSSLNLQAFLIRNEGQISLHDCKIQPMMSGGAKVGGSVDDEGNWTVNGEVSFQWGGNDKKNTKENKENPSDNNTSGDNSAGNDIDSSDRGH